MGKASFCCHNASSWEGKLSASKLFKTPVLDLACRLPEGANGLALTVAISCEAVLGVPESWFVQYTFRNQDFVTNSLPLFVVAVPAHTCVNPEAFRWDTVYFNRSINILIHSLDYFEHFSVYSAVEKFKPQTVMIYGIECRRKISQTRISLLLLLFTVSENCGKNKQMVIARAVISISVLFIAYQSFRFSI